MEWRKRNKEIFTDKEVDEKLSAFGIIKECLFDEDRRILKMGLKTRLLFASIKTNMNDIVYLECRIHLTRDADGNARAVINGKRSKLDLDEPFHGYTLTDADKKNLMNYGTNGKLVELTNANGQKVQALLGIDILTNQIVAVNPRAIDCTELLEMTIAGRNGHYPKIEEFYEGQPFFRNDFVNEFGQTFEAWVLCLPGEDTMWRFYHNKPNLATEPDADKKGSKKEMHNHFNDDNIPF